MSPDALSVLSLVSFAGDEVLSGGTAGAGGKQGEFNKFDKKYKNKQIDDGLYIMDFLWKLRQLRK